jgi:hypothetical protein
MIVVSNIIFDTADIPPFAETNRFEARATKSGTALNLIGRGQQLIQSCPVFIAPPLLPSCPAFIAP